ncbi:MAG: hypothetical protein JXB50_12145 [Spirochaetes bacterium]|nr:hypothetical protein [Spirochaetota bacterium]
MNLTLRNKTRENIQRLFSKAKCIIKSVIHVEDNIYSVIYYTKTKRQAVEVILKKNGYKLLNVNGIFGQDKYLCYIRKLERRVIKKNESKTCNALEKTGSNQENNQSY